MNCELFSIRGSQKEINRLNQNLSIIASRLSALDIQILFKTEVDRNTSKIDEAIIQSVNDSLSPEIIIMANALDKSSGADFISVFSKIIYNWETRYENSLPISKRGQHFHVKIFPIENLGCKNNGYCFTIYNTRIVVLPSETAARKPIDELIYQGVSCALSKFSENSALFPEGFDFSETAEGLREVEKYEEELENSDFPIYDDSENPNYGDDIFSSSLSDNDSSAAYETASDYNSSVTSEDSSGSEVPQFSDISEFADISLNSQSSEYSAEQTDSKDIYSNSSEAVQASAENKNSADLQSSSAGKAGVSGYSQYNENIDFISEPLSPKAMRKIEKIKNKETKKRDKANAKLAKKERKQRKKEAKREKKKQKKGFFRRNFPCRGDRPGEIARKIIILAALVIIIVSVSMIVNEMVILPAQNQQRQNEIQNIFYNTDPTNTSTNTSTTANSATDESEDTDETASEETDSTEQTESTSETQNSINNSSYNWDALKAINDEIIGWISIDNTIIDYPVLCHEDDPVGTTDPYYLHHNYANQWDSYGAIFTDPTSYKGLDTKNIVIHGHHMNDGSMFGNLVYYGTGFADGSGTPNVNLGFYQSSPIIHFNTPEWNADWKIIAVIHTNALESHGEFFNYLQGSFSSDEDFLNFVYNVRERSIIDTDVTVNENDQLITLSTCTYEFENFRTAVIARRVRPGESSSVNVSNASVNTDMVWPDVYYWTYGGTKPQLTSFSQAYANGEISWYDGDLYS